MMDKVLVTRRVFQRALDLLATRAEVLASPHDRDLRAEELLEMSAGCRALMTMPADRIDRAFLTARPEVAMVANDAVGYDNIDLAAARELGVVVTNTPGVLTEATADLTISLVLAVMRRLVEGDRFLRAGLFKGTAPMFMLGTDPRGKTLGVFGFGRIGQAVARRARAFGMSVIYHDVEPMAEAAREVEAEYVSFEELLARSDVVSINALLNDQTRGAFNYQVLRRMKPTAFLVNAARGPIVVEADLARALEEKVIAGAALDVYEFEPAVNPRLIGLENVVLSPHLGSATREVREAMALLAARNIVAFLEGGEPPTRLV